MTDPTGVSFLSYKRERLDEARLVVEALRDHGVPTWQDLSDLPHGTTETELERVLGDTATASAVLLVTPEVEKSDVIRETEAPLIFARYRKKDGFFALPVAAGGLDYGDVARILGPRVGLTDLSAFNIRRAPTDPLSLEFVSDLARVVMDHRLKAVVTTLKPAEPIRIQISTRAALPKEPGYSLRLDLRHRFDGRQAKVGAWNNFILPAFANVVEALQVRAPGREIILSGYPALPAAIAAGAAFLSLGGSKTSWMQEQQNFGHNPEIWGLHIPSASSGFVESVEPQAASGNDIALLVSATTDVVDDVRRSSAGLPLRAMVHVGPPSPRPARVEFGAGEARHVATLAIDALRNAWAKYGRRGTIHLFLAVPAGVAFMIGQQLNTFGAVQTYEHIPGNPQPYVPAALLYPSI